MCTFDVSFHEDHIVEISVSYERFDLGTDFMPMEAEDEVLPDLALHIFRELCISQGIHKSLAVRALM